MDTTLNYNETPNSQILPRSAKALIPEIFDQIRADKFRGNFLAVVGRQVDDRALLNAFWYRYTKTKSGENQCIGTLCRSKRFRGFSALESRFPNFECAGNGAREARAKQKKLHPKFEH